MGLGLAFALTSFAMAVTGPAAHAIDAVPITTCGQSVATDAVLVKNLTCAGDGVIITGDGVTVDLGGHVLRSTAGGIGVLIDAFSNTTATVRGPGKVTGFGTAIAGGPSFSRPHHVIVTGATLLDNSLGIRVSGSVVDVSGTTIRGANGITPGFSSTINIDGSSMISTGVAIGGFGSGSAAWNHIHIGNSQLRGGSLDASQDTGVWGVDSTFTDIGPVACSESYVSMERSRLVNTSFSFQAECGGSFEDNTFRSTSGGVALSLISRSWPGTFPISGNRFSGWDDAVLIGAYFERTEITGNRFEHNVTGIRASASPGPTPDCSIGSDGVIRNNTLVHNSGDAVALCGQWAVGGNRVLSNGGLGINAAGAQITDEGGNIARGNAEPQCVGVICTRR